MRMIEKNNFTTKIENIVICLSTRNKTLVGRNSISLSCWRERINYFLFVFFVVLIWRFWVKYDGVYYDCLITLLLIIFIII